MSNKKGFTLVELMAVAIIVAILTAVAVPQYRTSVQRAEATEALINLRNVFESAARYKAQNSATPTKADQLDVSFFDSFDSNDGKAYIGNFAYTFAADKITACRVSPSDGLDTYCFKIYYKHDTHGRGALQCSYAAANKKYAQVCSGFCDKSNKDSNPCWIDTP